jgi:hypothetical protein
MLKFGVANFFSFAFLPEGYRRPITVGLEALAPDE